MTPDKQTDLITQGAFAWVQHPIYALSLLLMLSTLVVFANIAMFVVAVIHCSMLCIKAASEESHLRSLHGPAYDRYRRQTNRFVPVRALVRHIFSAATPSR